MSAAQPVAVLLWLALAALVAVVLWIVLAACGLAWPGGRPVLVFCPADVAARPLDPALAAEQERQRSLHGSIRDLEIALLERPYCAAQQDPLAPCPQPQPAEVVLVLDASLSMGWDFDLDPAVERWGDEFWQRHIALQEREGRLSGPGAFLRRAERRALEQERQALTREYEELESQRNRPEQIDRIEVAKQALTKVVQASPHDVEFAFVSFNNCGAPKRHGHYTPTRRDRLLRQIDRIELGSSTALADTLNILPQIVRGGQSEEDPVNVVLVSDGQDSCGGDPCAAGAALKSAAPHVYVNVVAIGHSAEQARCVADATGGVFVQVEEAEALSRELAYAAGQDLPEHCR